MPTCSDCGFRKAARQFIVGDDRCYACRLTDLPRELRAFRRLCSECNEVRIASDFNVRQSKCKNCQKRYRDAHYRRNREKYLQMNREYARSHPELRRDISRRYARRHPDKASQWRREHPNEARAVARAWARRNPDCVKEHTQERRARLRGVAAERVSLALVRALYEGRCGICLEEVARADESLDHIVPLSKGGIHSMENVQLAHLSCNKRKNARWTREMPLP